MFGFMEPLTGADLGSRIRAFSKDGSRMNRILSVVRSMTDKIIELSRAVVTAPAYGESNGGLESIRSTY